MSDIREQKIQTLDAQRAQVSIGLGARPAGRRHAQDRNAQTLAEKMPDAGGRPCARTVTPMVDARHVIDRRRSVEADADGDAKVLEEPRPLSINQNRVGLHVERAEPVSGFSPDPLRHCAELLPAQQQRLAAVEADGYAMPGAIGAIFPAPREHRI